MVDFSKYRFTDYVNQELKKIRINYAFQPIYDRENEIYAYEALMRPVDCSIVELITRYEIEDKLHILEVATMFGAFQEYEKRGLDKTVCVNSFPTECLSDGENKLFNETFPESKMNGIIELLEYPVERVNQWEKKRHQLNIEGVPFAVDDFGIGANTIEAVETYKPNIVKLDISLISEIDKDLEKREKVAEWIDRFHNGGMKVLAEGIETLEEFEELKSMGIDLFQGFYLGRPE